MSITTILPSNERYEALSQGFNQRWKAKPDCIQLVSSTDDVIKVVTEAVQKGQQISVRSGGHCYENFVCNEKVKVIIDVSLLEQVSYDDTREAYCVGAGATNWPICTHLYRLYDLVVPGGSCYSVGAGGHICSGGFGLLSRQFGLTVDYLDAVEVVVVKDGKKANVVVASSNDSDKNLRDLWWAHTGGGGGNFGVITKYWFSGLPKPPKNVWLSDAKFSWNDLGWGGFHRLVDNYGKFFASHKNPNDEYADLFAILKLTHVSNGELGLIAQLDATDPQKSKQKLTRFYEALIPEYDPPPPRFMPWIQATQTLNGSGENRRGKYKSAYHRTSFTLNHIQKFYKHLHSQNYTNPDALLQIDSYGCEINNIEPHSTAVAQRDSALKLQYQTYWTDSEDSKHLDWIRGFYADVYSDTGGVPVPNQTTDGCFIGYPDIDLSDPRWNTSKTLWSSLYYKDNYPRLQKVKTNWDPANVFNHDQSIKPG